MALALLDVKYSTDTLPPSGAPGVAGARRIVIVTDLPSSPLYVALLSLMTPGVSSSVMVSVAVVFSGASAGDSAGRPRRTVGNSCSTTLRLPSRMLLSLTITSNFAVAMLLAKDRLPLTGTKYLPAMAVPGVALKGTLTGKPRPPERLTVIVALPAF